MNKVNAPFAGTCRLRLVMEVAYTLNGQTIVDMSNRLRAIAERAMAEGQLTGDTQAEVAEHTVQVRLVPEPLTEDEVADFMLERIENGDLGLENIPVRLARYGLMDAIEFSAEMRERMENSGTDPADRIAPELRTPNVSATVTSDTTGTQVEFDAAPWFAQASNKEIRDLQAIDWAHDYAADAVAEHFRNANVDIRQILNEGGGFECRVDEDCAMAWLKQHKIALWASLLCENNDVSVVAVQGLWHWSNISGKSSKQPFTSVSDACLAAIEELKLGN